MKHNQESAVRKVRFKVEPHQSGIELVDAMVAQLRAVSKTRARRLIADGNVRVNSHGAPPDWKLAAGDTVELSVPDAWLSGPDPKAPLLNKDAILFEDQHLLVINKPPGVSVLSDRSPGAPSLFTALLSQSQSTQGKPAQPSSTRAEPVSPGSEWYPHICHRLDKETSGVLVVCKTREAHEHLTSRFESRDVDKEYHAIVLGVPPHDKGRIDFPIAEHPREPWRMTAVRTDGRRTDASGGAHNAKQASTDFEVVERFVRFALVRLRPHSGRTHQVRVHMAAIGYPVACDKLYGDGEPVLLSRIKPDYKHKKFEAERPLISRLALHASEIAFDHPVGGRRLEVTAPLPRDMEVTLRALRKFGGVANTVT
jgi:RluA family pseudouridine synthase